MQPRIIACHLLNDFSGSPKILAQALRVLADNQHQVYLFSSFNNKGFLTDIQGVKKVNVWYHYDANPIFRLFFYTLTQMILFVYLVFFLDKKDTVYINTLLPYGAALAARLRGCRVVYHVHESSISPPLLRDFLVGVAKKMASEIVNVSDFVKEAHKIQQVNSYLIYNSLDEHFAQKAAEFDKPTAMKHVLMACSLKIYKGIFEFMKLAEKNRNLKFRLVLNASEPKIKSFFKNCILPPNVEILAAQSDMHPHYQWADVILNLSRPDAWVETFGMTVLEGMAYGLPAIVPPVGGITEVVRDGETGFLADCRDTDSVNKCLHKLLDNRDAYLSFSAKAKEQLQMFSSQTFQTKILSLF
ncbi:Glycosyltransferase involved in cell wall bisynthesis [Flexibacter flexilis DSM 6793]|uniref:Glycosyltransferase involved in cell wall bisynthesis n=1 Tax=Flexibacter flexilis DSM 6793 TaxID=927664 RepID=A0A1I1L2H6_9BACT|nr:glycosyltransferase family 4 protein [Flexibacter flexilis]SFC67191.1 Glycosyltransferase involved in cell wall bisynthesis [Flexibacter flexilis DSM 6793]